MSNSKKGGRSLTSGERDLWDKVKRTTTPLENTSSLFSSLLGATNDPSTINPLAPISPDLQARLEQKFGQTPHKQPRIVKPYSPTPSNAPTYTIADGSSQNHQLDQKTVRKISKGRVGIDGRVDLHGMTQLQAHARLFRAIENAWTNHKRIILVITGKGVAGEGILRQAVPHWLNEPEFRMMVSGISEASPTHGGSGALYVRIKRQTNFGRNA
ncbi:MAG: Smr/MutS family protein [Rhizobiaceae bacterium]|nr:Smr/MutS family protein [Rhizobiaceae bacterium]